MPLHETLYIPLSATLLPVSVKCCTSSGSSGLPKTLLSRYDSHFFRTW